LEIVTRPPEQSEDSSGFSLAILVERTGVPPSTIHHYRRAGLLPSPRRNGGNRLVYDDRHVDALRAIRLLRERRGVPLEEIGRLLPDLLAHPNGSLLEENPETSVTASRRVVDAAIELFRTRSYADVTVSQIAELAGVAKGSVYRYFPSKEALFEGAVKALIDDVAGEFADAVGRLNRGPDGNYDRDQVAAIFMELMEPDMTMLLELGVRAAHGDPASLELAVWMLGTLIEATGRPLAGDTPDRITDAGIWVIEAAFAATLRSALIPL
jgi:AcrR family transcriptional regulator